MITPITESRVRASLAFLQEMYERAKSDEIRAQYNVAAPPEDQEDLHGFQRGDAVGVFSALQILAEMERLKHNEKVFMTWLDILRHGSLEACVEIWEAYDNYQNDLRKLEAAEGL